MCWKRRGRKGWVEVASTLPPAAVVQEGSRGKNKGKEGQTKSPRPWRSFSSSCRALGKDAVREGGEGGPM